MNTAPLYPLKFNPILRRLIWGGRRLGTVLNKPIGTESDYAESWEVSDYRDQVSVVENGALAGTTLRDLVHSRGAELLGAAFTPCEHFPLLVKFIDAHESLSVQVHPDDEKGRVLANDSGKTETWVILDARPGALIYAGLKSGVSRDRFAAAIKSGGVEPMLNSFEPRVGDSILIESGTVHAIGAGILLTEIQEMSDATFRIDDWGRVGPDGKPRPLHIEKALQCIDFDRGPVAPIKPRVLPSEEGNRREGLAQSKYFALERLSLTQPTEVGRSDRFTIVMALTGSSEIEHDGAKTRLDFGQTALLPAAIGSCRISPSGDATLLTCVVP